MNKMGHYIFREETDLMLWAQWVFHANTNGLSKFYVDEGCDTSIKQEWKNGAGQVITVLRRAFVSNMDDVLGKLAKISFKKLYKVGKNKTITYEICFLSERGYDFNFDYVKTLLAEAYANNFHPESKFVKEGLVFPTITKLEAGVIRFEFAFV